MIGHPVKTKEEAMKILQEQKQKDEEYDKQNKEEIVYDEYHEEF
jgi:hypothetical protein